MFSFVKQCDELWVMCVYAALARTVAGSMHGRHQLCKESQYTEAEQVQGQVPL